MGVLVGTSLIVIIPEGVDTLYTASDALTHKNPARNISPLSESIISRRGYGKRQVGHIRGTSNPIQHFKRDVSSVEDSLHSLPGLVISDQTEASDSSAPPPKTPTSPDEVHILSSSPTPSDSPPSQSYMRSHTPHVWIGLSLILGFILMYLLDTLPSLSTSSNSRSQQANIYSLSDLSSSSPPPPNPSQRALSTTLGLCIHAAADGIALGASSSSTSTTSLSLIIFIVIMVHKAPAAFGLTAVLLRQGLGKRGARAHLLVFSLAAPIGAVGTWVIVRTLGGGVGEEELMKWWTGVLLLFSGGTFL